MHAIASTFLNDTIETIRNTNTPLLGEIVTWSLAENIKVPYQTVLDALDFAGLEKKVARTILPRNACARAFKTMEKNHLIRQTNHGDPGNILTFQFTKERLQGDEFTYDKETVLALNKITGQIYSTDPLKDADLIQRATELLAQATDERKTRDISSITQRLYTKAADIFPVRPSGGFYFVPTVHTAFTDKVEVFINQLQGTMIRFPVAAGTAEGNRSVRDAVESGLRAMVDEHMDAVMALDNKETKTQDRTYDKLFERIDITRLKVESYAMYLEDKVDSVKASLDQIRATLKQKIAGSGIQG